MQSGSRGPVRNCFFKHQLPEKKQNPHPGTSFDDFLKHEEFFETEHLRSLARIGGIAEFRIETNMSTVNEETSIRMTGDFESSAYGTLLRYSLMRALAMDTSLPEWIAKMSGMSGKKYRYFINTLVAALGNARYLEIGTWTGSTACSAMSGNRLTALCVDNWSLFGGPKKTSKG
jgi:hypothetical protein